MEILNINQEGNTLKIKTKTNEESVFLLLKTYLETDSNIDIIGVYKEHHLIDETELFIKVKKDNAKEYILKALKKIKKDLENKKIK